MTRRDVEEHSRPAVVTATPVTSTPPETAATQRSLPTTPIAATTRPAPPPPSSNPLSVEIEGTPDSNQYGEIIRSPLSQARKSISQVMSTSWTTIPHVTDCNDADISELETLRRSFNDPAVDRRITSLAFVIRAVCRALGKFPILNSTLDENSGEIIFHRYVNVGIGVDTPRGLVAPGDPQCRSNGCRRNRGSSPGHHGQREKRQLRDRGHTRRHLYDLECGSHGRTRYSTPIITPDRSPALPLGEPARCHGSSMTKSCHV